MLYLYGNIKCVKVRKKHIHRRKRKVATIKNISTNRLDCNEDMFFLRSIGHMKEYFSILDDKCVS